MRKPTQCLVGWALLVGGLVVLAGVTAEAQITPGGTVNRQRAATAPASPYVYRQGGYYYYYTYPYYGTRYAPAPAPAATPAPAPAPNYAPTYGYSQPGYRQSSGATVAGYRYLDNYATGRGLPLAKPWAKPLR